MPKIFEIGDNWKKKLNDTFTERYDYKFWLNKIKTHEILLEKKKEFLETYGDEDFEENSFENYLKSEIVFTFYHITESLFILIMGTQHTQVPWVQINEIKTSHIKDYIENEIKTKKFDLERIRTTFYNRIVKEKNEDKYQKLLDSSQKIQDYLIKLSDVYLKQDIYQSFKHGLRVIGGQSKFAMFPEGVENPEPILGGEGDSFTYLNLKFSREEQKPNEKKKVFYRVEQVDEIYDYELFLEMCKINYKLIANIMSIRKQFLKKEKEFGDDVYKNPIEMEIHYFDDLDLREIFQVKKAGITRFSHTRND